MKNNSENKICFWNKLLNPINKNNLSDDKIEIEGYLQFNNHNKDISKGIKKCLIYKNYFYIIDQEDKLSHYLDLKNKILNFKFNQKLDYFEIIINNYSNYFKILIKNFNKFKLWIKIIKKYSVQINFDSKFELEELIHKNKFSNTSSYLNKYNNKTYIVKKYDKMVLKENQSYKNLYENEKNILLSIKHENVIKIKESYEDNDFYYLVFKKFGESLKNYIIKDICELDNIISQIIDGLKYIHSLNLIHRDIKPSNILIKKKNNKTQIKIIDFGLSCSFFELNYNINTGTVGYIAPEYINFENKNADLNFKSDIYSLGCTIYYLLKNKNIFSSNSKKGILILNKQSFFNIKQSKFNNINNKYKDILCQCLKKNPTERINLDKLDKIINN